MAPSKEDILRQFCDVTGADESRCKFFLESSNWQLDVALSSFYEHGGNIEEADNEPAPPPPIMHLSDSDMESPPLSPVMPEKKEKKKPKDPHFGTLASLQQESSSEEEGEAFYAGGSERSGQQILGPGKGRKDIVTEMFKSVRERGAVVFDEEQSSSSRGRGGVFSGVGYRLGQTADDHEQVTPGRTAGQQENQPRAVRLQLYREGFSVDGGPLRQYSDPDNAEFLGCIRRGEIPAELSGRGEVRLSLEDRRHEDCPRAASRHQAFSGKGQMLGSPTPATVGATVAVAASSDDRAANQRAAQEAVALDENSPVTTVQFRLADGSRLTGRFNHTHTVADLIQYVSRAEPIYQLQPFVLLTSFPSTELSDRSATLAQANLLNTTLLQRLK
ncbi:NSFL1 cofactor p47 [Maniola jurtina]|uniref:NSFL1 cofactor p47 n=1 Tax=Maniola jurtina TaxID=191418 RepID=UPI001E687441|nr:NSFL1 cofactor p47 [Maniola jurtina]